MGNPVSSWRQTKLLRNYLNRTGRLLTWTKVHVAPSGFEDQTPYFSGIVEFADMERLPVQIVDCVEEDLKVNLKLIAVIRKGKKVGEAEIIEYVVKVKPLR